MATATPCCNYLLQTEKQHRVYPRNVRLSIPTSHKQAMFGKQRYRVFCMGIGFIVCLLNLPNGTATDNNFEWIASIDV